MMKPKSKEVHRNETLPVRVVEKRKSSKKEERWTKFPMKHIREVVESYSKSRVSKEVLDEYSKATEFFFNNLWDDLITVCEARHDGVLPPYNVNVGDFAFLMRQLHLVDQDGDYSSLYALVSKYLPMDIRPDLSKL